MARKQNIATPQISIPYLVKVGDHKTEKIGKYLADKDLLRIALFLGKGMDDLIGDKLYCGFKAHGIDVVFKETINDVDIDHITHAAFALPPVDAVLGIGGGKALDFAKYSAYLLRLPFISVPTSTSNDGFCSPTSSLTVQGNRKTVKSGIPYGVVMDLDLIKNSPKIFLYSGIGDMVSKVTALWDWKQAALKGTVRFSDFASLLAYNSLDLLFLKFSSDIYHPAFQRSLANSLLTSGIAMEAAGTSRPASGSEHLISHALDAVLEKPKAHGIQVGVATYLCALLQNNENFSDVKSFLTSTGFLHFVKDDPFLKSDFIKALHLAPTIKDDYYTILSEADSLAKAEVLIETDDILKEIIR